MPEFKHTVVCLSLLGIVPALFFLFAVPAAALGKGPIGVWPASERYALIADTSIPGVVLVDLETGIALERLATPEFRPVGIASCRDCQFALVSGGQDDHWLLHFGDTVGNLLSTTGKLQLGSARLERFSIKTAGQTLKDGRMCLVSDDAQTAFVASSEDRLVARVDFARPLDAETIFSDRKAKPYGLNWDRNGDLLVTMHKNRVLRMTVQGKVLAVYDIRVAACPGIRGLKPNLRAAVDDPVNAGSLLVLASNPKSYDAVVWRLSTNAQGKQSCVIVAGNIGRQPGWVDAAGEAVEFSRPHYFAARPRSEPPQLILTDIDNRALRLLDLTSYTTSSLMYHTDRALMVQSAPGQRSASSCAELSWPMASFIDAAGEYRFCNKLLQPQPVSFNRAQELCAAGGARMCTPAELMSSAGLPEGKIWSSKECTSCWQRTSGESCEAGSNHKTPDLVHSDAGFSQRWHSGRALIEKASASSAPTTLCLPEEKKRQAVAVCCADVPQK